ncbi:hypothetical protein KO495_15945 [Colwellia sp. D2M02]|uniref:Uncharacterized protein n=1 Tax=Colwellia asteriadis TaxID=517723 RepID=A0ABN1LAK0_9GAMM|nr:hypothetical protein [Colwellia sp. D2M02]MBU2894799.1 hypothetical protein [Colwellia sp. D2M02]
MSLVIKKWFADEEANENGDYVHLVGRESGLLSWLLSLLKIDSTNEVEIKENIIKFTSSSLAGQEKRIIPMQSITSAYYGYQKPWQMALALTVILAPVFFIGFIVGPLYYFLNKSLTVAVVESSGWVGSFSFKRSIIEGQNINEEEAYRVIEIIRERIEAKTT